MASAERETIEAIKCETAKIDRSHALELENVQIELRTAVALIREFVEAFQGYKRSQLGNGIAYRWHGKAETFLKRYPESE